MNDVWRFRSLMVVGIVGVLFAGIVWAIGLLNVAPDAVTKATEGYNLFTGELASLTDGQYPGNDASPGMVQWGNKGFLVFELPEPAVISEVRVCVGGNAAPYEATFFLGAKLGPDGQARVPEGEKVGEGVNYNYTDYSVDPTYGWETLKPEIPPVTADYVQLSTESGPEIYEVEIWVEDGTTAVRKSSWGGVKFRFKSDL
ncbi:MAG: hypothetical protein V1800_03165 [Candidatus Latescibacterota bacterium]